MTDTTQSDKKVEEPKSSFASACDSFKTLYSVLLLIFAVTLVMAAIFSKQTVGTAEKGIPPIVAFFVFWFLIFWLGVMEGGQGCLVGLQPVDKSLYAETHPTTLKNTTIAHRGDNMERFIVGRQFLVVLVVFVSSFMSSSIKDAEVLGLPDIVGSIFFSSGLALILVTITIGQLTAQVNAANCMIDFVNNRFMLYFVTYVAYGIEFSGLLHAVYLVQIIFAKISGQAIESKEPPRSQAQNFFFWVRVLLSSTILGYAFAVTFSALFNQQTTMWDGVPPIVSVVILFVLMCFVGMMEGLQIALFAVINLPEKELAAYPAAQRTCELAFRGKNLQAFLIGRQICVTICMFIVARITTLNVKIEDNNNIFGVSDGLQSFFNTGLLGAVITTICASLVWRVIASSFSVAFISNPLIYLIINLCLLLEKTGLCNAAWLLAKIQKAVFRYKVDEEHIGDRGDAAAQPGNDELHLVESQGSA
jgi:hypothetical protein